MQINSGGGTARTDGLSGGRKRKEPKKRRLGSTSIAELNQEISEPAGAAPRILDGSMPRRRQGDARCKAVQAAGGDGTPEVKASKAQAWVLESE